MLFARDGSHGVVGEPSLDEVSEEVVRRISEVVGSECSSRARHTSRGSRRLA